tara:strand:- start:9598 stop:10419 length:822 start_codon:yes stop_codon:yes gene_type:complete
MLKKRLIFTLLYDSGSFMLSRNFRLQRVGDIDWLQSNYDFSRIAFFIDELIILDVTKENKDINKFCEVLQQLTSGCFAPIAAGGGVRSIEDARMLLNSGADKIVINTPLFSDKTLVKDLAKKFGQQCLVGSVDILSNKNADHRVVIECGTSVLQKPACESLNEIVNQPVGEIYLNSINQDGTGQGFDLSLLNLFIDKCPIPIIIAGGVGNAKHLAAGLSDPRVDSVATANLFNFIGDGLKSAREQLVKDGHSLAFWPSLDDFNFKDKFSGTKN